MCRNILPLRLVQILANVLSMRVVCAVPLNRDWSVVGRPKYICARIARTGAPSAEPGEQINCCCHYRYSPAITGCWRMIRLRELETGANRQSRPWVRRFWR